MQHSTHVSVHARPDGKIAAERPQRHGQFWEPDPTSLQQMLAAGEIISTGTVTDAHVPFLRSGVPAIDLIDFDFRCWHKPCDDLDVVSERSLDAVGETVLELVRRL